MNRQRLIEKLDKNEQRCTKGCNKHKRIKQLPVKTAIHSGFGDVPYDSYHTILDISLK